MRIQARVRFRDSTNAEELIQAFFKEFNPENCIIIKGNEALVEFSNDEPPEETIKAIQKCEILELTYGVPSPTLYQQNIESEHEIISEEVATDNQATTDTNSANTSEHETASNDSAKQPEANQNENILDNPELYTSEELIDYIAKNSVSYNDFINRLIEFLGLKKKAQFFSTAVMAAENISKISWKNIEGYFEKEGRSFTVYEKVKVTNQIAATLKRSKEPVSILKLLNIVIKYKDYKFVDTVKLECMPDIPEFEELLTNMDKSLPVKQKVTMVLTFMGLDEQEQSRKKQILDITVNAIRQKDINQDSIVRGTNIAWKNAWMARATLAEFISKFVKKYDPNANVKVVTFLQDLQAAIVLESEIDK